jgi:hypothetical protein
MNSCKGKLSLNDGAVFNVTHGEKPFMFEIMVRGDSGGELFTLSASSDYEKKRWMDAIATCARSEIRPSGTAQPALCSVFFKVDCRRNCVQI